MPTYRVDRPGMDLPRMVEAAQPSAARKHVADSELTVRRIEIGEALALQKQGVEYETVGEEPAPVDPEPEQQTEPGADDQQRQQADAAYQELG